MKTKHLLTALALPAIFAACTADDIETVGVNSVERVALNENFKLNFGGVESRMTAGKPGEALSITFEANDEVGGAIVDTYDGTNYKVVDYVSTNHPFVYDGATWNIEHTMVEGNYLFYYPYNENNHNRSAAAYSIPVMQDLSDKVTGEFNPKAAVEKYAMSVGHQFLDKEDLSASVQLAPIFSYARLVLKLDNAYAGGEIDKIVLQAANEFKLNGQISNTKVYEIFDAIEEAETDDEVAAIWAANNQTAHYALDATLAKSTKANPYYNEKLNKGSKVMVGKLPAGVSLKVDAQNNKSFETYMVMPAQSVDDMVVYLYMKDGRVYSNYKEPVDATFNRNTPKKVEVTLVKSDEIPYIVTSEKDWNEYVSLMGKEGANFIIAGDDFTVTNTTKYPTAKEAIITVKSALKVTGNNVTMKNIVATENVTVEKGAVLNTDKTATYTTITNKGTLNVTKVVDAEGDVETYAAGEIINEAGATLNVNDKAAVSMKLNNKIDKTSKQMPCGAVVNNGTIEFTTGSQNSGEITNNGSLTGTFTNNAEVECTKDDEITFTPIITNNGEIFASDAWNNNGKIINAKDAEITVSKFGSAAFNNAGEIKLANGSHCLISSNAGGELVLETLNQSGWAVQTNGGTIAYSTQPSDAGKAYDFETTGKGITKIYVNGNLGITKKGALTEVVVEKNATLNMPKAETIAELTVEEGVDVIINASDKDNAALVTTLEVKEEATVTINKDNSFECDNVSNKGIIYVGGSFTANVTKAADAEAEGGKYKTTSTSGSIKFGKTAEELDEEAKIGAFQNLIQVWADNFSLDNVNTWNDVTVATLKSAYTWTEANAGTATKVYNDAFDAFEKVFEDGLAAIDDADNATYFADGKKAVIAAAKTSDAIKAVFTVEYNWFGTTVYKKDKDANKIYSMTPALTNMYSDFATAVADYGWTRVNTDKVVLKEGKVNGALYLTLKSVDVTRYWNLPTGKTDEDKNYVVTNATDIPAYSYIEVYEGTSLYKVLKLMAEFDYAAPSTGAKEWQTALANACSNKTATMAGVIDFYNEVYKVYKDADSKLTDDLVLGPKVKAIADEAATVVTWKYTKEQIKKAIYAGGFGVEIDSTTGAITKK